MIRDVDDVLVEFLVDDLLDRSELLIVRLPAPAPTPREERETVKPPRAS